MRCMSCGVENPDTAKFCSECGIPLAPSLLKPDAERRQLTVMFCDLVGSTALSEQLDPEDWRELLRAYQRHSAAVIERFEGHVAQYLGDGLLVYFGHPIAHEDDAQRAVRAGLGVLAEMAKLNSARDEDAGVQLDVRIGIHTGPVVVGPMGTESGPETILSVGGHPISRRGCRDTRIPTRSSSAGRRIG